MEEYKKQVIGDILLSINTYEKVIKFEKYRDILGDCKIYLFDEEYSNLGSSFGNYQLGICGIYGAGDYTKTWVIDSFHDLKKSYLQIGKTLDLDLNIFTYLNNIMQGRNMKLNRTEIVDYLNYIKLKGFQCGITSALMERATKYMPLNILSDMLISFVKFDKISYVDESKLDIYLNEDDYAWAKQMYDMALALSQEELKQYDIICCCRNNCILEEIDTMESIRRIKIKTIDFRRIKQQLQLEIHGYQDEMRRL